MPGHYLGHLTGKAAAQSDLSYEGGQFMIEHYDDSGKIGDVKASLKSDLDAEAQAEVSGAQEAYVNVDGGKKGGSEFKAIFHPGQLNAGAKADARVAGQYGLYDGYFGGKGRLDGAANAASDLSYDGGHFEFISKTGGEGGSKVDFSAKNDLAAKGRRSSKRQSGCRRHCVRRRRSRINDQDDLRSWKDFGWSRCRRTDCRTVSAATECQDTTWDI